MFQMTLREGQVLPVNARTSDAEKYAQVPTGPPGALVVTVNTVFVVLLLQHPTEDGLDLLLDHFLLLLLSPRLVGHFVPGAVLVSLQWSGL